MDPITRARPDEVAIPLSDRIRSGEPLGYFDFLCLQASRSILLTDAGEVQEETTPLGIPYLTLGDYTERPATIVYGANSLAGTRKETILCAWNQCRADQRGGRISPLWDGQAGVRGHAALRRFLSCQPVIERQAQ